MPEVQDIFAHPRCGYVKPSYNSCRNRHCPKCQTFSKERWIDAWKADLLNNGYFYVVFTVPQELNGLVMAISRSATICCFRCAAETLQELAADKKYLGAAIGHTAVLHTWGQNLCFHPHIHCIVPSGGLTSLGKWQSARKKFFLPVKVLSRKFRGKFLSLLKQQFGTPLEPDMNRGGYFVLKYTVNPLWKNFESSEFRPAGAVIKNKKAAPVRCRFSLLPVCLQVVNLAETTRISAFDS